MSKKKSDIDKTERSFSRQFDAAMIETRMIGALAKADGWSLADLAIAPPWLQQVYTRHAVAAYVELKNIESEESAIKPSEHR